MTAVTDLIMNPEAGTGDALARSLRHRDPDVLEQLVEQFQYRLFRYLLYLTGNRAAAEDIFQETWIRVLERGHQYNGRSKFEAWLFTIARNLVIDRGRQRKATVCLDDFIDPEEQSSAGDLVRADCPSQLDSMERREESKQMDVLLRRMPALYREALLLRFNEGLSLPEIAIVVSAPLPTVKSRIYRGIELLRDSWEGYRP